MLFALLGAVMGLSNAPLSPVQDAPFSKPGAPIRATLAPMQGACQLVLLDAAGTELARAAATPGALDLAALFPAIQQAKQALRVQLLVADQPQGAPLLVVPLVGRPTMRTTTALRPDGKTAYTRIIGWGDQLLPGVTPAEAKLKETWAPADPAPLSGFRVEPDMDVVFETTAGPMRFAMRPDQAPNTARNFVALAAQGFYDGTIIHRVVPKGRGGQPFVIQGGDPTGTGDGGPGYDIPLEPSTLPHDFGVLSMARNDWPDSAGSQWFVALTRAETARLDGQYCAFGYAVSGTEAILATEQGAIADADTGRPVKPVTVTRARAVPALPWTPGRGRPDAPVTRPATPPPAR